MMTKNERDTPGGCPNSGQPYRDGCRNKTMIGPISVIMRLRITTASFVKEVLGQSVLEFLFYGCILDMWLTTGGSWIISVLHMSVYFITVAPHGGPGTS